MAHVGRLFGPALATMQYGCGEMGVAGDAQCISPTPKRTTALVTRRVNCALHRDFYTCVVCMRPETIMANVCTEGPWSRHVCQSGSNTPVGACLWGCVGAFVGAILY